MIANPKNLFEVIGDSFFSYDDEMKVGWRIPSSLILLGEDEMVKKKKMTVMRDFLMFLVYLMSDELCLLNMNTRTASADLIEADPNNLRVIRKAATNVLLSEYWTEYGYLKENMSNSILLDESKIGRVISQISINNEKEQKIRVKDELEVELDPYMFYKTPLLQADVINEATARIQKNQNIDIVAGKSYTDLQKHLFIVREKLFQSNLPAFLREIVSNFSNLQTLIPTTLKLILLHTQQCSGAIYQIEEEILKREEFKECRSCIQKIKGNTIEEGDEKEMKKKIGLEKMNKMKEEFLKKQAMFADKNKEAFEEGKEEKGGEDMMTCPYCLVKIDAKKDTYGIPVFINYTNNFTRESDSARWGIDSYNDLEQALWMPVLSSCHHYYHQKCFGESWRSVRESDEVEAFKNPIEACCSLCKTLCNDFLILNENESLETKTFEITEKPLPSVYYLNTCQKMLNLLEDHRMRIAIKPPAPGEKKPISFSVILKRMMNYFMETLHLNEKNNELFELYLNFYKSFKKLDPQQLGFTGFVNDPLFALVIQRLMILGTHQKDESDGAAFANFVRLSPESLVNEKFSQITLQSIHSDNNDDFARIQIDTLREYVEIRLLQSCILSEGAKLCGVKDCAVYYKNNMDIVKELIRSTLGISLCQFALHIYFNNCILQGNQENRNQICQMVCERDLDEILKLAEIPYTVESLGKECVESIEKNAETGYLLLNHFIKKNISATQNQVMAKPELLVPRFLKLPETFDEFNKTIYRRKCFICKEYDGEKNMHFCLLCGIVVCEGHCLSVKKPKGPGNLNAHAILIHMGTSMYYHLFENVLSIVASPYNVSTMSKSLYSDSFGQTIEEALEGDEKELLKIDFKQFVLNKNFVQELKSAVMNQEIEKEYFKTMLNIDDEQEIPEHRAL